MVALIQAKTLTLFKINLVIIFVNLYFKSKDYEKRYYLEIVEYSKLFLFEYKTKASKKFRGFCFIYIEVTHSFRHNAPELADRTTDI